MNISSLPTLALAALLTGFSAPAAASTAVLARCDAPMAEADQMTRTVDECSAILKAADAELARIAADASGPEEKIVTSSTALSVDLTRAAMAQPLLGRLVAYYAYSAFAAGDPRVCDTLNHLSDAQSGICRRVVADLGFVRARHGSDAELVAACRRTDGDSAKPSPCCALLAQTRALPDPCAKLAPKCFDAPTCRAYFASAKGDARACRSLPNPPAEDCTGEECPRMRAEAVANCEGDALYAKAHKARSAAQCGASERCRALMGEGKAVARQIAAQDLKNPVGEWFLKSGWTKRSVVDRARAPMKPRARPAPIKKLEFRGFACGEPLTSPQNRAAAAAVLGAAQACLTDLETALARPTRDVLQALDERAEKLARHSLRLNRHFSPPRPAKSPARAPR